MRNKLLILLLCIAANCFAAKPAVKSWVIANGDTLRVTQLCQNAIRVQLLPRGHKPEPASFYTEAAIKKVASVSKDTKLTARYNPIDQLSFHDAKGNCILSEATYGRVIIKTKDNGNDAYRVSQTFQTPADEYQFGTGQFQDGNLNVKGLTRRLTQVNTQIALPMIISNKGYGILWNNCGMTDFNPASNSLKLEKETDSDETVVVNTTSTTGNKREERHYQQFVSTLNIEEAGEYSLLLDVGQSMARRHYVEIDGNVLYEANNIWLPPTAAFKATLTKGEHKVVVRGERNDKPSLYYNKVKADCTTFSSPVAQTLDYTVFSGSADEIIASYRALTGEVPMLPRWALGYVHCRERYVSQDDVVQNAAEFRKRNIPIDMIVQDWQWWGNTGWNSMEFDPVNYSNPKSMVEKLHEMDIKLMLSVWAKVDHNSKLGKQLEADKHYIPNTDWIDFFSKEAGDAYWTSYKEKILPTGIDAWWQDATEPENDDLTSRMVDKGKLSGNAVRNIFPFAVNDVVYNGLLKERPNERPMIMTRSASPGIQRFGVLTWSGDVGNDYKTLERQIAGGLGQMAAGVPWWTYDAGGFFRPGNQHTDPGYQKRMLRWIQNAVYLPVMRVHGYMSQTEPWRYQSAPASQSAPVSQSAPTSQSVPVSEASASDNTYTAFVKAIRKRYNLISYLYSEAARVSREGSTMMRPLVFDFPNDEKAMQQTTEYMLGKNILVCPATSDDVTNQEVYLPTSVKWYRIDDDIHAYAKGGSIIPWDITDEVKTKSTSDVANSKTLGIRVFPGADAEFTLYEDDGTSLAYQNGEYSTITFKWNDAKRELTILPRQGSFPGMESKRWFVFLLPNDKTKTTIDYNGKKTKLFL